MTQVTREAVEATISRLEHLFEDHKWYLVADENGKLFVPQAKEAAAMILSLQAELGEARKDVERYRWLRDNGLPDLCACINGLPSYISDKPVFEDTGAKLDALIDAARESARGEDE